MARPDTSDKACGSVLKRGNAQGTQINLTVTDDIDQVVNETKCSRILIEKTKLNVGQEFKIECFEKYPLLKSTIENVINRPTDRFPLNPDVKTCIVQHALKHSITSALDFSRRICGPMKTTLQNACKSDIPVLPFIKYSTILLIT